MRAWGDETEYPEAGCRFAELLYLGGIAGNVIQFPGNAPTTYAHAKGVRIGAFDSWEAAKVAVEKSIPDLST